MHASPTEHLNLMLAMQKSKMGPEEITENQILIQATKFAKLGDFEQAIVRLKTLLEAEPEHEVATGMLASIYAQLGMADRAIGFYQKTLAINPGNSLA